MTDDAGKQFGQAQTGWVSDPAAAEFRSLRPNRQLLEELARQTGGRVVDVNDLDSLVRGLPKRSAPVSEQWTYPLWHQPTLFLFAIACLIGEWGLRRWRGMA